MTFIFPYTWIKADGRSVKPLTSKQEHRIILVLLLLDTQHSTWNFLLNESMLKVIHFPAQILAEYKGKSEQLGNFFLSWLLVDG